MLRTKILCYFTRNFSIQKQNKDAPKNILFENVFSLPQIKYIAMINRLKVYHLLGTSIAVPSCGLLEILNVLPNNSFITASYIGLTGAIVLSLPSIPFWNTIGFLYVSEDNKFVKISCVNFWGKRKDRVIDVNEWIPLFNLTPKLTDGIYLTPQLTDGTKYKLIIKFGKIVNATKMSQVLE